MQYKTIDLFSNRRLIQSESLKWAFSKDFTSQIRLTNDKGNKYIIPYKKTSGTMNEAKKPVITVFSKAGSGSFISDISNTYAFEINSKMFIIDPSCGKKRYREVRQFLGERSCDTILCTHYHNDHIANNGRLASSGTKIIYHKNAEKKTGFLRTNSTGQILMMYNRLDRELFLRSLGFFSKNTIRIILKYKFLSEIIMPALLFVLSYALSLKSIGRIYTGRKKIVFMKDEEMREHDLGGMKVQSWEIAPGLYAVETPGHTDCHVAYYLRQGRILFAGDSLNFLNPNDIQFGEISRADSTRKLMLRLVKKLKIEILYTGHYLPLTGNSEIAEYISDIINKHDHVYKLTSRYIKNNYAVKSFAELYAGISSIDDDVIKKLTRITFPRSTLVFFDVYIYKNTGELQTGKTYKAPGT